MEEHKPQPDAFIKVLEIYLDRLTVKKMIIPEFETAKSQVYFDMLNMFNDEENRNAFKKIIDDFENFTCLKEWYEGE